MKNNVVIADSSPLINLMKASRLNLLEKLYGNVIIPKAVFDEINQTEFKSQADKIKSAPYIQVREIRKSDERIVEKFMTENSPKLDRGESEVIVLADEMKADLLIIDERKGRNVASTWYQVIGAAGVIMQAYDFEFIDKEGVCQVIDIWKSSDKSGLGQILENAFNTKLSLQENLPD